MATIYRGMTRDGSARALFIEATDIVERARQIHNTYPTATAALGRTLIAASLIGSLMAEKEDLLTIRFKGDGLGGAIVASSDYMGNVRGFIEHPDADPPLRSDGKLNVGACVGRGELYVLRDVGGKEPYVGISEIRSGEIAEDIAGYFTESEQIPTLCALGVLIDRDRTVKCAGGVLIQLLPFADEETADRIEVNASKLPGITALMQENTAEQVLDLFLEGIEYDMFDDFDCGYKCVCSREKTDKALISLGAAELTKMIETDGKAELTCSFCDNVYKYSKSDLKSLLTEASENG